MPRSRPDTNERATATSSASETTTGQRDLAVNRYAEARHGHRRSPVQLKQLSKLYEIDYFSVRPFTGNSAISNVIMQFANHPKIYANKSDDEIQTNYRIETGNVLEFMAIILIC